MKVMLMIKMIDMQKNKPLLCVIGINKWVFVCSNIRRYWPIRSTGIVFSQDWLLPFFKIARQIFVFFRNKPLSLSQEDSFFFVLLFFFCFFV